MAFNSWLNKLVGKPDVCVTTYYGNDRYYYDGTIILVENELCLFKEREKSFLFRIADIIEISGDEKLFNVRPTKKIGNHPFWQWLKNIEKKCEVEIVTEIGKKVHSYYGRVIKVEPELCLIGHRNYQLIRIADIVEIGGKEPLFDIVSNIEIEEIE